jgi:hypothetical protein
VIDELGDASKWLSKPKPRRKQQISEEVASENKSTFSLSTLWFFRSSSLETTAAQTQSSQSGSDEAPGKPSFI